MTGSLRCTLCSLICALGLSMACTAHAVPVADAGPDQTLFLTEVVALTGSSIDDGDPIRSWFWNVDSAPAGSLAIVTNPFSPVTSFQPDALGEYVLSLTATDTGNETSAPDTMLLTVLENQPPVAIATADVLSGFAPLTVSFDGSQSFDPEGGSLSSLWSFGDGSLGSTELSPTHTFIFPGNYLVDLGVIDDFGLVDSTSFFISVGLNDPVPAPEPGALALFGLGLAGLGFARRRSCGARQEG